MTLIDGWRGEIRRLWSIRVAAFWGGVSGIILVWPALASVIPLWLYAAGGVVMCASIMVARLAKQPGAEPL